MKTSSVRGIVLAVLLYGCFAGVSFHPYLKHISGMQHFFIFNCFAAAIGAYILSRRWIFSFVASLIAGAIYGFGPFALGFVCYHPFAGLVYAAIPYSLLPAVYLSKWTNPGLKPLVSSLLAGLLSLLPFAMVLLSFKIAAMSYLYAMPVETTATGGAFFALLFPLFRPLHTLPPSVFHLPLAGGIIGMILLVESKRVWITILLIASLVLSFYEPIGIVPPVIWLSIPVLMISLIVASGLQALIVAGRADSIWLGTAGAVLAAAGLTGFVLSQNTQNNFLYSAQLYALATITIFTIFFMARANIAAHKLRALIILLACSADIVITTTLLMQTIF